MTILRKAVLSTALATAFIAAPAAAYQAGDSILRLGPAGVYPNTDSDPIVEISNNAEVDVDSAWSLGITATFMVTDNIGVGVLAAWPFSHDIEGDGDISNLGDVAETKHLPPTVTAQWHLDVGPKFHPYVGVGVNYTTFFDEDTKGALDGTDFDLDDSWGLAGEVGVDVALENDWLVSGQVWYIDIDTEADIKGFEKFDVEIDPWVFMLGVGRKF